MNITTRARRTSTAFTLAMAALAIAACTTEESIPEAPESATSGPIEFGVTPSQVAFNDAGAYRIELERDDERAEATFTVEK